MNTTIVFFDLETGGLKDHHPDIQLAAVAVLDWKEVATFERKIQFHRHLADPEALKLNSYDRDVWREQAIAEETVVSHFKAFLYQHASMTKISQNGNRYSVARLAGHHAARFDAPRLKAMFERYDQFLPGDVFRPLDTLQLALWHFTGRHDEPKDYKLGTLAEALGIATPDAHDALGDVRTTIAIAKAILERGTQ